MEWVQKNWSIDSSLPKERIETLTLAVRHRVAVQRGSRVPAATMALPNRRHASTGPPRCLHCFPRQMTLQLLRPQCHCQDAKCYSVRLRLFSVMRTTPSIINLSRSYQECMPRPLLMVVLQMTREEYLDSSIGIQEALLQKKGSLREKTSGREASLVMGVDGGKEKSQANRMRNYDALALFQAGLVLRILQIQDR